MDILWLDIDILWLDINILWPDIDILRPYINIIREGCSEKKKLTNVRFGHTYIHTT